MGAVRGTKSPTDQNDDENLDQRQPPQLNVQDIENNNNHIFINPHDRFIAIIDECDLLNNNSAYNNNYITVTYSPSNVTTATTITERFSKKSLLNIPEQTKTTICQQQLSKHNQNQQQQPQKPKQQKVKIQKLSNGTGEEASIPTSGNVAKKMQRDSPKKHQQQPEKISKEKKKKKEKPKAPRAPNQNQSGGVGGRRGMSDQEMMRRPRRNLDTKTEK
jgi:hypothetical protein